MSAELSQHLLNVVERRGFAAALDAIEPARSGTGATQQFETDVDRLVGQTTEVAEMTTRASS